MQHERGNGHVRQHGPHVGVEVELKEVDAASADAAARCMRVYSAISSPLACGSKSPASICAPSIQFVRMNSISERLVTSGMSSREA